MKPIIFNSALLFLLSIFQLSGQQANFNAELVDFRNDYPDVKYADVWGYNHVNGTEYAIIGLRNGVAIYQVTDDEKLKAVKFIGGDYSTWRDIKSYGDYVYAIDDSGNDGLMVIDMSGAPESIAWDFWRPLLDIDDRQRFLDNCHNLWIDENGVLYLAGCNMNNGGVIMADLVQTPGEPVFLGPATSDYSHDCYAKDNILWSADLYKGYFSVNNVTDKGEPVPLAVQRTGARFTHNVWLSDDDRYLFTTDEVPNAGVEAYDVQDLENIALLDSYRPAATLGRGVIPHNVHYYRGYLVISYYTDGVKIVDARRPDNLVEVGSYDTWLGPDGGFNGCWGAFPFLASGLILVSNINDGLYLIRPDYQRACYLEGKVTDAVTGAVLSGVQVEIQSDQANEAQSKGDGVYKTGQYPAGVFEVTFIKEGYQKTTATAALKNGEVAILDVEMQPLAVYTIQGRIIDALSGDLIPNAQVVFENDFSRFEASANEDGRFTLGGVYNEKYDFFIAAWGYRYLQVSSVQIEGSGPYNFEMTRGYEDDFLFDLGWTTESDESVSAGFWEWGRPRGTSDFGFTANTYEDIREDFGEFCYVTGNDGGLAQRDDVDNGAVRLLSPNIDLSAYDDPVISYYLWFYNTFEEGDDSLKVFLVNREEKVLVEQLTEGESWWREKSEIRVKDFLTPSDSMRLILETADQMDSDHIVEAAIDGFLITDAGQVSGIGDLLPNAKAIVRLFPNPTPGAYRLEYRFEEKIESLEVQIFNAVGQMIYRQPLPNAPVNSVALPALPAEGVYFLRLRADGAYTEVKKVVRF